MLYIYTVCYNTPDFIEPQYKLLKKFIKEDFVYVVFNNTNTNKITTTNNINNSIHLNNVCNSLNILCFDIPKEIYKNVGDGNASKRAGLSINYATYKLLSQYGFNNTFFLIDSDAFLINEVDVENFMENKKISGRIQKRITNEKEELNYITNQVVIFKPSLFLKEDFIKYFSFDTYNYNGCTCDCGGRIHYLFKNMNMQTEFINWNNALFSNKGTKKQLYGGSPSEYDEFNLELINELDDNLKNFIKNDTELLNKKYPFCEIFTNDKNNVKLLHLRAGTNWINFDINKRKTLLHNFLKQYLH